MHSPETLIFSSNRLNIQIWHIDPCKGGNDDSCGWFKRAHHGDQVVLERIIKRFEFDWDRTFTSSETNKTYARGLFTPGGDPLLSVSSVVLNLFWIASFEFFGEDYRKASRFCQRNLFAILFFAENPVDSLRDSIALIWGRDAVTGKDERDRLRKRTVRIHSIASVVYGWILRREQKWWDHPRWHIHHWQIQIGFLNALKRWLFSRCNKCGKRFRFGYAPVCHQWGSSGPMWFKGESGLYHSECCDSKISQ
jgi:hypothetical protein